MISPNKFIEPLTLVLNSSGTISIYIILTSARNLGGNPKCNIQFKRAPITNITSAYYNAVDLAGDMLLKWSSEITPLPIGVGRKGSPVTSINFLTYTSDRLIALPFPTITNGFLAFIKISAAYTIKFYGASHYGISLTIYIYNIKIPIYKYI